MINSLLRLLPATIAFALSKLTALAVGVAIARLLNRTDAGLAFFLTGLITLSVSVTTLGLAAAANFYYRRNVVRRRFHRNRQAFILSLVVAAPPSIIISLFSILLEEARATKLEILLPIVALCCYFGAVRYISKQFFQIENMKVLSIALDSLIFNGCLLLFLVISDRQTASVLIVIFAASATSAVLATIGTFRILTHGRGGILLSLPSPRYAKLLLAISLPSMIAQGGAFILNKADVLMLAPLAGALAVGDYSVAIRLTYITGALPELIVVLMAARITAIGSRRDAVERWNILKKATAVTFVATAIASAPMFFFSAEIIELVFGPEYLAAVDTYRIILLGKLLTAGFAPALVLYTTVGYNRDLAKNALLVSALGLLLMYILIPRFGAAGAAIATTISLALMCVKYTSLAWKLRAAAQDSKSASRGS